VAAVALSRPVVGSSKNRRGGGEISSAAMLTRFFSPPADLGF
jgi:hypothetical protein